MKQNENSKTKSEIIRIGGILKEVVTVFDESGKVLHSAVKPLMIEFYFRDFIQVVVGSVLLATPVGFTQEVWELAEILPMSNIIGINLMSLIFIAIFVYYNYYRVHFVTHWHEFLKRVLTTYIISLLTVSIFLTLIDVAPWSLDMTLAVKRVILVAFPASISAAVVDVLK